MSVIIRAERAQDHTAVFDLITRAFAESPHSDHREQYLVERLRNVPDFLPELSLVAAVGEKIVGHILFTPIDIHGDEGTFPSLALAPVSVLPEQWGRGIGGQLIEAGHARALSLGFTSVVVLGHADYYPRFGYRRADTFDISLPFTVPPENCMAVELTERSLAGVSGTVAYPPAFMEE